MTIARVTLPMTVLVLLAAAGLAAGAAHADPAPPVDAAAATGAAIAVPPGTTASFAVYDRQQRRFIATRDPHAPFRSASVVKLLIALDELIRHDPPLDLGTATTDEQRQEILSLQTMLRASWDDAASAFWVKNGFTDVITRMTALIGLTETSPPADRGIWGYTAITASDVVKIYNYLLDTAPARYREFIIGNLFAATRCAQDGRDQSFGMPQAFPRPWGVKQGWSGWGATIPPDQVCADHTAVRAYTGPLMAMKEEAAPPPDLSSPLLHSTGIIGDDERTLVVVLTTFAPHTSWPDGAAAITAVCRALRGLVPGAAAAAA